MLFTVFINIKNMRGVCQDKSFHFLSIKIKYDLYYNVTVLLLAEKELWMNLGGCLFSVFGSGIMPRQSLPSKNRDRILL